MNLRSLKSPLAPMALGLAALACVCSTATAGVGLDPTPAPQAAATVEPPTAPAPVLRDDEQTALDVSPATYVGPNCFTDTNADPDADGVRPCTCSGEVTVVARVEFSADGQGMTLERTLDGDTTVNTWTRDPQHREQWLREITFEDGLAGKGTAHRTDRITWTADGYQFSALIEFSDATTTFCKPRVFTRQP